MFEHRAPDYQMAKMRYRCRGARPWRLAELTPLPSESHAATKAWQVSRQSGFRARLTAMRREMEAMMEAICHAMICQN
jgi:hypothetical protein